MTPRLACAVPSQLRLPVGTGRPARSVGGFPDGVLSPCGVHSVQMASGVVGECAC